MLQSLANDTGGISLVWFAGTCFSIALILIGVVWRQQIEQNKEALKEQKELNKLVSSLCNDLAVIRENMKNTNSDISRIRDDVDEIRREVTGVDRRLSKLEAVK